MLARARGGGYGLGMLEASVSAAFAIVGLVIFLVAKPTSPDWKKVGEIMFFCGLLTALLFVGPAVVGLGQGTVGRIR